MNEAHIPWSSHHDMVVSLFKVLPGAQDLHHATTGIAGEVAELHAADSMDNIIEECGDIEFYIEAAWQALERRTVKGRIPRNPRGLLGDSVAGYVLTDLVISSGHLLDLSKKAWIYNKPIEEGVFMEALDAVEVDLDDYYKIHGIDRRQVINENMAKLAARYPAGYTDAAAQARADKETPNA